jgi:hypothetical protein
MHSEQAARSARVAHQADGPIRLILNLVASPLVAATLVTIAFFVVTAIGLTRSAQEHAIAEEKLLLNTFALSLSEHIEQAMKRGDDLLKQLRHAYLKDPRRIKEFLEAHNQVVSREVFPLEAVMDADGLMVASNTDTKIPTPRVDLSDREHFRVHKEAADPSIDKLFVSKVLVGRVSKKAVLQLTRAMRSPSGEFLGVAVVSLSPDEFIEPYRHMGGSDSVISIIGFTASAACGSRTTRPSIRSITGHRRRSMQCCRKTTASSSPGARRTACGGCTPTATSRALRCW